MRKAPGRALQWRCSPGGLVGGWTWSPEGALWFHNGCPQGALCKEFSRSACAGWLRAAFTQLRAHAALLGHVGGIATPRAQIEPAGSIQPFSCPCHPARVISCTPLLAALRPATCLACCRVSCVITGCNMRPPSAPLMRNRCSLTQGIRPSAFSQWPSSESMHLPMKPSQLGRHTASTPAAGRSSGGSLVQF